MPLPHSQMIRENLRTWQRALWFSMCEVGKKIAIFWRLWKNPELILFNMFSPIFVPNLVTLAWTMSPGMPKEAGSLNGPLRAYSMKQNLHNPTLQLVRDLRVMNVLAKFENDPWKIADVRVLTGLFCPAARPPACPTTHSPTRATTISRSP